MYVYFKECPDKEISPELQTFKENYETDYKGNFYLTCDCSAALHLDFLLQLERYLNEKGYTFGKLLSAEDANVRIDGEAIIPLQALSFAGNNPEYKQLMEDNEEMKELVEESPNSLKLRAKLDKLEERREQMERSLFDTARLIANSTHTKRFREASDLFNKGDNKGALAVLNLNEIEKDVKTVHALIDADRNTLKGLIDEYKLRIQTLQNEMADGWFDAVCTTYDKALAATRGYVEEKDLAEIMLEYGTFLWENKQYHLVSTLYYETLAIYRKLAEQEPETYLSAVAQTLNNQANLHDDLQQYTQAEEEYCEALKTYRQLAEQNSQAFLADIAMTQNNLAALHSDLQQYTQAEEEYGVALKICRQLAEQNPQAFLSYVADTLSNIVILHKNLQQYQTAELECREALAIYKELAEKVHPVYQTDVADAEELLAKIREAMNVEQ